MTISSDKKTALCLGGNGFIGHHMARRLKEDGYWVRVVDIKPYEYGLPDYADEIVIADLRLDMVAKAVVRLQSSGYSFLPHPFEEQKQFDEIYQFAADMGGAGFVFTGDHDADIMHNSATINLNLLNALREQGFKGTVFYSSSACMYPQELQEGGRVDPFTGEWDSDKVWSSLVESDAYPANPDSEYGWEKLFSERLYLAYARNHGLDVRIARFHNIYGPLGTYQGGREKAPAAMCRKAIECARHMQENNFDGSIMTIWGDGKQTRSFLYIDDCIDAVRLLMQSDFKEPINIGSEEMVTIDALADLAIEFSGKPITKTYDLTKPQGVRGRNSDNTLIRRVLGWSPEYTLREGMEKTFNWIKSQYK